MDIIQEKIINKETMTEKKIKILEVCIELFAKNGYANTSTSQIAKLAGVAEGTIFKHFGKKEDILKNYIIPYVLDGIIPVLNMLEPSKIKLTKKGFEELIFNIVDDRLKFVDDNENLIKILLNEILYSDELKKEFLEKLKSLPDKKISRILEVLKKEKIVVDMKNEDILRFIISNIVNYPMIKIIMGRRLDREEECKKITYFIVNGITLK